MCIAIIYLKSPTGGIDSVSCVCWHFRFLLTTIINHLCIMFPH